MNGTYARLTRLVGVFVAILALVYSDAEVAASSQPPPSATSATKGKDQTKGKKKKKSSSRRCTKKSKGKRRGKRSTRIKSCKTKGPGDESTTSGGGATTSAPVTEPAPTSGVFVSSSGSDTAGSGTVDRPYRTLQQAAASASPGDTVYVRGGTYISTVKITRSGTSSAPITFRSYPGETAVLDGTGVALSASGSIVEIWNSSNLVFQGFEVRNSSGRGISVLDSANVAVRDNRVHDTWAQPIMGSGDYLSFQGNDVYRGVLSNQNGAGSGYWAAGISTWLKSNGARSTNVTIAGNRVRDTWGEGIIALHVNDAVVLDNTVSDVWSVSAYVDNAAEVRVERNIISNSNSAYYRDGRPAAGVSLANEYYANTETRPVEDITIANNTITGASYGIGYWQDPRRTAGNTYRNVRISGNVINPGTSSALWFDDVPSTQAQPSGNVAANNTMDRGANGSILSIADLAGWALSNNVLPDGTRVG